MSPYVLFTFAEEFDCVDTQTLFLTLQGDEGFLGEIVSAAEGEESEEEQEEEGGEAQLADSGSGSDAAAADAPSGGVPPTEPTNTTPTEPTNPTQPTPPTRRSPASPLAAMTGVFLSQAALVERAMLSEGDLPAVQAVAGHSVGVAAAILASASAGQGATTAMTVARCDPQPRSFRSAKPFPQPLLILM